MAWPRLSFDNLANHVAQVSLDGFPVKRSQHQRHRLCLRIVEETQAGKQAAHVGHAEPSSIAFKHAGERHLVAQGVDVDKVFLGSPLSDGQKFHGGKIRTGGQPAAELRPFHERFQQRRPELEKAHLHSADLPMHRLLGQRRGLEHDAVDRERFGQIDRLEAAAAADMLAWENSGFSVDASVRITLTDRDVPSYFRSLEHLLRYCARPPFALERLSVIRGPADRITQVRYVLPRHKAANWVGPGRGRKSTRPGANGVVELTPFEFRLSSWTGSPISCRRRGSTGIATTECLRRITS